MRDNPAAVILARRVSVRVKPYCAVGFVLCPLQPLTCGPSFILESSVTHMHAHTHHGSEVEEEVLGALAALDETKVGLHHDHLPQLPRFHRRSHHHHVRGAPHPSARVLGHSELHLRAHHRRQRRSALRSLLCVCGTCSASLSVRIELNTSGGQPTSSQQIRLRHGLPNEAVVRHWHSVALAPCLREQKSERSRLNPLPLITHGTCGC